MKGYYIGMDGGGTGTKILVSSEDRDLCRIETGGLNYNSFGRTAVAENLNQAVSVLKEKGFEPEGCLAVGIGCAGISNPVSKGILEETLLELGYTCPIYIFGDQKAAMYGALGQEDGILLISGTGSICLGQEQKGKREYRAGGFGHLIDDEGSAYALGRDILSSVARSEDGRGKSTALKGAVFERLGISSVSEMIGYVYEKGRTKDEIASLALLLAEPEIQKDAAAVRIIDKAAKELSCLVLTVFNKMRGQERKEAVLLVLHGSVLKKNELIREKFLKALEENWKQKAVLDGGDRRALPIRLADAKTDAVHGAVDLAKYLLV